MGKISDYTRVLAAKLADVFVVDQTDNGTTETKSATVEQIGTAIGTLQNFADLDTSNKSLVDAINEIAGYTPVYGNTASGAIATFDTSLALPLQDLQIAINAVQTGTLPPSPSNVCPISGFTGANIHVADDETPHIIDNVTAITWQTEAGTVYGGSLDVTSGVLTVTKWGHIFNGSESFGEYETNKWRWDCQTLLKSSFTNQSVTKCSHFLVETAGGGWYDLTQNHFMVAGNQFIAFGYNGTFSTFLATEYANGTPVTIVALLQTPVTYQLTPTQISAIVGTNNVFTDTNGNTSVVYACSLKDYIDSQ